MSSEPKFKSFHIPLIPEEELVQQSQAHLEQMQKRRSCRHFSDRPVPRKVMEHLLATASSAPSGANKQPWYFVAVGNPMIKRAIRIAAEREENDFYQKRAPAEWLRDLKPLGTDWTKTYLEKAPWLIVVFRKSYELKEGSKAKNYYVQESVGIASGLLISAIHQVGLATLTHTPSPMTFLSEILNRPENEKPYLLMPVGYPAEDAVVPDIDRKPLEEVSQFLL